MVKKVNSFQFMLKNRKVIIGVLKESSSTPQAWKKLLKELPEIEKIVKFNTFKSYANFLNIIDNELDEKASLKIELDKVRQQKELLEKKLDKVSQQPRLDQKNCNLNVPKHVKGWGVQYKGRYYRLFKKINGKVKWIHIGREWNLALAERKIRKFKKKK